MTRLIKTTAALFLLALVSALTTVSASFELPARPQTASTQSASSPKRNERSITTESNQWRWRHSDNGVELEVTIRGRIEFADDYSDITSISEGGSIKVSDDRGGVTRKFEARAAAGGVERSYWVNGQSRALDGEARSWLAKVLDETVRQGGYDARARVQRILSRSGPRGVLQEISRLKGDYVKRLYFDELIKTGNLDDETVRQVLSQAANEIHSDYEKAQLLVKLSDGYLHNDSQRAIYLEGVNTIHSDYEKGRALGALLKRGDLSRENVLFTLRSVGNITSDYERAQLLIRIAEGFTLDNAARTAYLEVMATLHSDYEKGRVLSTFLQKGDLGRDGALFVLKSASSIVSDYEKAQVLIKVAAAGSRDEAVRDALVEAARTIHSEYERGRVLNAVFK